MAKKRVAAIVKIQIPAGKATPAPPVGTALGPHGVAIMDFVQAVQRGDRGPGRHDHPGRDHGVRGSHVHVRPEDAADAGAAAPEGRAREGLAARRARPRSARSPRPTSRRSPRSRCPTSTPTTSRPPSSRSAAPPARWASVRLSPSHQRTPDPTTADRDDLARRIDTTRETRHVRQEVRRRDEALRSRPALHARPRRSASSRAWRPAKFDETVDIAVRLGVDPRKADQMVRGTVALPSGTGKDVRVAVFAAGDAAEEARDAGADIVGADDLAAADRAGQLATSTWRSPRPT